MSAARIARACRIPASLFVLTLLMPAWVHAGAGGARVVGRPVPLDLQSSHPYEATPSTAPAEWTVHSPGATYIRLHVQRLQLAPGDHLEIASPDGSQSFLYTENGPHGDGEFWANSVQGDTALIRLHVVQGGAYGFWMDRFGSGTAPLFTATGPVEESVCGATDWQDAICYDGGPHHAESIRSRSVAHLLVDCCTQCTGFRVSDAGQYLTAHACIPNNRAAHNTEIAHHPGLITCGGPFVGPGQIFFGEKVQDTDPALGHTLFSSNAEGQLFNRCLPLEAQPAAAGDTLYIPHHPVDRLKKISLSSDLSADGLCHVQEVQARGPVRLRHG